jgi:acyl-CoA reductase-like NAD-dependent aldehyde dehydrogenase
MAFAEAARPPPLGERGSGYLAWRRTGDLARGEKIAEFEIEAGMIFVNDNVRSDPRVQFGGIKESGSGRELSACGI